MKARTAFLLPPLFPVLFSCKSPTKSSSRSDDPWETFSETLSIDDFTLYFDEKENGLVVADYVGKNGSVMVPASLTMEQRNCPSEGGQAFPLRKRAHDKQRDFFVVGICK